MIYLVCLAADAGQLPPHRRSERGCHSSTVGGRQLHGSPCFLARPPPAAALPKLAAAGEPGGKPTGNPAAQGRLGWVIAGCCSSPRCKLIEALWAWKGPLAWCPCLTPLVGRVGAAGKLFAPHPKSTISSMVFVQPGLGQH